MSAPREAPDAATAAATCEFEALVVVGPACTEPPAGTFRWVLFGEPGPSYRLCARHLDLTVSRAQEQGWPHEATRTPA